jgi:DNA-binding NarL/FixJ family response regulator
MNFVGWAFLSGWEPGLQLDRENNAGNYTPTNCRWVTDQVNSQNRRSTRTTPELVRRIRADLTAGKPGKEIALETGLSKQTVSKIKLSQQWQNII